MADFSKAFDFMIPHEGGYVNHPNDPGGETKYGITKKVYPDLDIRKLTLDQAKEIYRRDYWNKWLEAITSQPVANKLFDLRVNMGWMPSVKITQGACIDCGHPIVADGVMGPVTVHAINESDETSLLDHMKRRAKIRYENLIAANHSLEVFRKGWMARADA